MNAAASYRPVRAGIAAVAAMLVSACSTLQIDVDVYKGPLVNNEEVQRDQLVSMAMSAKTLMYTGRNKLLDDAVPGWSALDSACGRDARARALTVFEIADEGEPTVCGVAPVPEAESQDFTVGGPAPETKRDALRKARQLNLVLAFYAPIAPEVLRNSLRELQAARARQLRAQAQDQAARQVLETRPGDAKSLLLRQTAVREESEKKERAKDEIVAALYALREAAKANANANALSDYLRLSQAALLEVGTDTIGPAMRTLTSLQATGFEAGRLETGVDQLATEYAEARDEWINVGKPEGPQRPHPPDEQLATGQKLALKKDRAFSRLQHTLTDLASRMQFLATNLFLVDDSALEGLGLRGTLEAVANTILVHADDLGRQRQFEEAQQVAAGRERAAATTALLVEPAVVVRRMGQALAERVKVAQKLISDAAKKDIEGKDLRERRKAEQRTVDGLGGRVQPLEAVAKRARALHVLLGAAPRDVEVDPKRLREAQATEAALRAEGKPLMQELRAAGEGDTLEALRKQLSAAIDAQLRDHVSPARSGKPSTAALHEARHHLETWLQPMSIRPHPAKTRSARVDAFVAEIAGNAKDAQRKLTDANEELIKAQEKVKLTDAVIAQLRPTVAAETAALAKLPEVQKEIDAVLKGVAEKVAQDRTDAFTVRRLFSGALNERAKTAAPADQAGLKRAAAEVETLPAVTALELPTDPTAARDTQDEYIAQLRYRWLEEVRNRGAESPSAERALKALEYARKMREDSIYLRPASTYLRSALPITALQNSTRSEWTNMLLGEAARTPRELWNSFRQVANQSYGADAKAKTALDRAHWQNINAVRVSGAGNTNFAIAKDDVGNWYVKAMGADPVAMANTARRLAIFNTGRSFDANLLRADELRTQIDAGRKNGDDVGKHEAELTGITRDRTGAATAVRSDTLALFKKNYDEQSLSHLTKLRQRLQADSPLVAVKKRVSAVMAGSDTPAVFDDLGEHELVKDTYGRAVDAVRADVADKEPGKAVIAALVALDGTRTALRSALAEDKVATAAAVKKLEDAKAEALLARNRLVQREADAKTDAGTLASATAALKALPETATTQERATAAKRQETLLIAYDAALGKVREAQEGLTKAEALRSSAEGGLALAKARVAKASEEVESVFRKVVDDLVTERLRVIAETETAVKVVGEALTAGGANGAPASGGAAAK